MNNSNANLIGSKYEGPKKKADYNNFEEDNFSTGDQSVPTENGIGASL